MSRYVTRRVNGSWQVQDSELHGLVMGEYGPGSDGYNKARLVADNLNDQPTPTSERLAELSRVLPPVNDNDLRSSSGLRAWRHAHKLSQQKLADLLEVHMYTVSRWELGQVPIPRTVELALRYLNEHFIEEHTSRAS